MLPQAVAVINGKGGVGKTSITSNLGGMFADAGLNVLLADLDPQGNLSRDLGYRDDSDDGQSLFAAVTTGAELHILRDVRPSLDVVCGGEHVEDLAGALASRTGSRSRGVPGALRDALEPYAGDYDLILLDCPPGNRLLQTLALVAARWALIPTKADEASLDGLVRVADLFTAVRKDHNPELGLLGVVLFAIGARSRRIADRARQAVGRDLGDPALVFDAEIRLVEGPAADTRRLGLLAHEIEARLPEARAQLFAALRRARGGDRPGKHRPDEASEQAVEQLAASAPHLAGDYQRLAEEITKRLAGGGSS